MPCQSRNRRFRFRWGLASVIVDRVFDGIVVLILLVVAMLAPSFPSDAKINGRSVGNFALIGTVGLVVGLVALFWLVLHPTSFISAVRAVIRPLVPRWEAPIATVLRAFHRGSDGASRSKTVRDRFRVDCCPLAAVRRILLARVSGHRPRRADCPRRCSSSQSSSWRSRYRLGPGFVGVFEIFAIVAPGGTTACQEGYRRRLGHRLSRRFLHSGHRARLDLLRASRVLVPRDQRRGKPANA